MLFVAEFIRKHQSAILEKQNLTLPRLDILRILKRVFPESITITNIKEEMIYKTIDHSRMIDKMKREGLVNATKNKTTKEIAITVRGLDALSAADKYYDEMFLAENYLTEENARKINEALQETLGKIK